MPYRISDIKLWEYTCSMLLLKLPEVWKEFELPEIDFSLLEIHGISKVKSGDVVFVINSKDVLDLGNLYANNTYIANLFIPIESEYLTKDENFDGYHFTECPAPKGYYYPYDRKGIVTKTFLSCLDDFIQSQLRKAIAFFKAKGIQLPKQFVPEGVGDTDKLVTPYKEG